MKLDWFDYVVFTALGLLLIAVLMLGVWALYMAFVSVDLTMNGDCSEFANWSMRNIPARCIEYWENAR